MRPNVLVILTDDQGYGDFSCHGHPLVRTPNIDRLHDESVRLTDFHVAPMCTPTRSQLMTGVDCLRNGAMATSLGRHLPRLDLPMMPRFFADGGYRTGIFGKWHLGSSEPYLPHNRGFQEAIYHLGFGLTGADDRWNNDYFDPWYRHNGQLKQAEGYCTDFWFDQAMRWMGECQDAGEPFFCYLPTNVPHFPMWVEDVYKERFATCGDNPAGFFGMIEELDGNMAQLDAFLRDKGLRDNTILIFMTDNGHAGGALDVYNAGMRGGKCSRYEGGHRVPCFVRWPEGNLQSAGDVNVPTQVQDILPTLIDLCQLPTDESMAFDGTSIAPLLRGEPSDLADRRFVVQYFQNSIEAWDAAVVWRHWRLVFGKELYDLRTDPGQEHDVASENPKIVDALRAHYEPWWEGVEPVIHNFSPLHLGCRLDEPAMLTSCEWENVRCDGQGSVRGGKGGPVGGPWNVQVEAEGRYAVELRRWPREAELALAAAAPEFQAKAGVEAAGVALPVAGAAVRVGQEQVQTSEAASDAREVTFTVPLRKGRTHLHGWFRDAGGHDVCGAYYAYVARLS
jgi:arylsulfatase A-like enzyme